MTLFKVVYWIASRDVVYTMSVSASSLDEAEAKTRKRLRQKIAQFDWVYQIFGPSLRDGELDTTKRV